MRRTLLSLTAFAVALPATLTVAAPAGAHGSQYRHSHYNGRTVYKYCRRSPGTTGLVAGGIGGAVVGSKVLGGGVLGIAGGAVGGALAGRAVDRTLTAKRRCRR